MENNIGWTASISYAENSTSNNWLKFIEAENATFSSDYQNVSADTLSIISVSADTNNEETQRVATISFTQDTYFNTKDITITQNVAASTGDTLLSSSNTNFELSSILADNILSNVPYTGATETYTLKCTYQNIAYYQRYNSDKTYYETTNREEDIDSSNVSFANSDFNGTSSIDGSNIIIGQNSDFVDKSGSVYFTYISILANAKLTAETINVAQAAYESTAALTVSYNLTALTFTEAYLFDSGIVPSTSVTYASVSASPTVGFTFNINFKGGSKITTSVINNAEGIDASTHLVNDSIDAYYKNASSEYVKFGSFNLPSETASSTINISLA